MSLANAQQAEYWSTSGKSWATHQEMLDQLLSEPLEALLARATPTSGETVLDIGCGTGASAIRLSKEVSPEGQVIAADISAPLLERAKSRGSGCENISFILGDAQTYEFGEGRADLVFSRFGVMFFADSVAAFENLRRSTRPGGRLAMICWQGAPENPWFMDPMKAAVARLGKPEPLDPYAPGPMAFKDIDRVIGILEDAGWVNAKGEKIDVDLLPPKTVEKAAEFATTVGPASRVMREKEGTEEDLAVIQSTCAEMLQAYQTDDGLKVPARLIVYSAVNPKS